MFKEQVRTQNKIVCIHRVLVYLIKFKIQKLKICLELLFDICANSLNCHNGGNKGGQIQNHHRTFSNTKRVLCATIVLA